MSILPAAQQVKPLCTSCISHQSPFVNGMERRGSHSARTGMAGDNERNTVIASSLFPNLYHFLWFQSEWSKIWRSECYRHGVVSSSQVVNTWKKLIISIPSCWEKYILWKKLEKMKFWNDILSYSFLKLFFIFEIKTQSHDLNFPFFPPTLFICHSNSYVFIYFL